MLEKFKNKTIASLLSLVMAAMPISAKNATVNGKISTDSGNVDKALVTLVNEADTTQSYADTTDAFGDYVINDVPLAVKDKIVVPSDLRLEQNYPNPFNPSTRIPYSIDKREHTSLKVYNILGQEVRTLVDDVVNIGNYEAEWDGRDNNGRYVASGVYLYVLTDNDEREARKMVLLDGGAGVSPRVFSSRLGSSKALTLEEAVARMYRLVVRNTDLTEPRIVKYTQHSIPISSDTTINVVVGRAYAPTIDSLGDIAINEDEPGDSVVYGLTGRIHDDSPINALVIELLQTNPSLVNLRLDDSLRIVISYLQKDGNGYSDITVRVTDPNGLSAEESFRLNVSAMDDIRGEHRDNDTDTAKKAKISVNGVEYETTIEGLFDFQVAPAGSHTVTARTYDEAGNPSGYRRTEKVGGNQDISDLVIYSVSYPTQEGISPELFKAFCEEGNFRELWGYTGLKTMIRNPNRLYWISSHGDSATASEGGVATAEQQTYVKSLIDTINTHFRPENRTPVYVENPDSTETIPFRENGYIVVVPHNSGRFGVGPMDEGQDGIIDWAIIYLPNGQWDEAHKASILQELLSAVVAPNEVSNIETDGKTVLHGGFGAPTDYLTQIDMKLIRICETYKPKEQIEDILGL